MIAIHPAAGYTPVNEEFFVVPNQRKHKKSISLWICGMAGAIGLLSACGKPGSEPLPEPTDSSSAPLRILAVGDPFAMALESILPVLENELGKKIEIDIVGYNDNRRLTLLNANDHLSRYDLVSFDNVWLGEYTHKNVLRPLGAMVKVVTDHYVPGALAAGIYQGQMFGLPIQPHAELLWVRKDWFEAAGRSFPRNTDELLDAARAFHDPANKRYGIAWNAQRGQPLGQTMSHIFAVFGQALLDENGFPVFDTERGLRAARYVRELVKYSPPDILNMAWDQRVGRFASGNVAMTYGWGARAFMVEDDPTSKVRGKVLYGPPPSAPGGEPVTPLGVWSLGIPTNAAFPKQSAALLMLLFREDMQRAMALKGNGGPPVLSLINDAELQARYPVLTVMASAELQATLRADIRPANPKWDALCEILGNEFHDMLMDRLTPEEALRRAQQAAAKLFNAPEKPNVPSP